MKIPALTPLDRFKLIRAGVIKFPAPKELKRPSMPPRGKMTAPPTTRFARRAANLCLTCGQPAVYYGDKTGYGVLCQACLDTRAARRAQRPPPTNPYLPIPRENPIDS